MVSSTEQRKQLMTSRNNEHQEIMNIPNDRAVTVKKTKTKQNQSKRESVTFVTEFKTALYHT